MNKKLWKKPVATVDNFTADEYISSCGASGVTYNFKCTAGKGMAPDGSNLKGAVFVESNNVAGLQVESTDDYAADTLRAIYQACDAEITEVESSDTFLRGYYCPHVSGDTYDDSNCSEVWIWTGTDGDNTHCTTLLDMSQWETLKS